MKKILKKIIPTKFWKDPNSLYSLKFKKFEGTFYSQEGEDILLSKIFEDKESETIIPSTSFGPIIE